jgi:hypothetical protein
MFLCDTELSCGPTIRSHLAALYNTLFEQNLLPIIEPYQVMEIEYVVQQGGQSRQAVGTRSVYAPSSYSLAADQMYFMGCWIKDGDASLYSTCQKLM